MLKNKIKIYESQGIEININEDHKVAAITTPIMRKFHTMDFAKEIVFIDSSGSCDQTNSVILKYNCKIFFFGLSNVEGIPLGVVFHISQTKENYLSAFKILKEMIGPVEFGGLSEPTFL